MCYAYPTVLNSEIPLTLRFFFAASVTFRLYSNISLIAHGAIVSNFFFAVKDQQNFIFVTFMRFLGCRKWSYGIGGSRFFHARVISPAVQSVFILRLFRIFDRIVQNRTFKIYRHAASGRVRKLGKYGGLECGAPRPLATTQSAGKGFVLGKCFHFCLSGVGNGTNSFYRFAEISTSDKR